MTYAQWTRSVRRLPLWAATVIGIERIYIALSVERAMARHTRTTLLLCGLLVAVGSAVSAQARVTPGLVEVREPSRRGWWVGGSVGAGSEAFRFLESGGDYGATLLKPTLAVRGGGTVGERVRLGVELFGWFNEEGGVLESITSAMAVGQWYPIGAAGLHVRGGLGFGRSAVESPDGYGFGDLGFATMVGAGYDLPVARGVWIVPSIDVMRHTYTGRTFAGYRERIVNLSIGVLFQPAR